MKKLFFLIFCLITLSTDSAFAIKADSLQQKENGLLLLPVIFYSPETRLAGGAVLQYYFHLSGKRPSSVLPAITYTQNHQIMSEINADLSWNNDAYQLHGRLAYTKFPNKFYGIGNHTPVSAEEKYTPKTFSFRINLLKKVFDSWRMGLQFELNREEIVESEKDGLLARGIVLGSKGGLSCGTGIVLNKDTRDNIYFPQSGSLLQCNADWFGKTLGSDFIFSRYSLDVRKYWLLLPNQVLALQAYGNFITGRPPFRMMSLLGGREKMRGYFEGRFRDKNMLTIQFEYRLVPIWRKIGLAGFFGLGDVAADWQGFNLKNFKYSFGAGLRYVFDAQEHVHLRLDFALGQNSSGLYLTIGEAF